MTLGCWLNSGVELTIPSTFTILFTWSRSDIADFRVAKLLYENLPQTKWVDEIIVESQRNNIYGGKGVKDDLDHTYSFYNKFFLQIKIIIWKIFKRK